MGTGAAPARLVVNADDFGLDPRVNEGIVEAHRRGIVTATSLMAVGDAFAHAVDLCAGLPHLDVGVHLTLVAERPLLPSSSLAGPDGRFPPDAAALLCRYLAGSIRLDDVTAEWSAQIERVLAAGIRPSHLDSHQHVHILPGLAGIARNLAVKHGIFRMRLPLERPARLLPGGLAGLTRQGGLAALWGAWLAARLTGVRPHGTLGQRFLGFLAGGRLDEARLLELLRQVRPGRDYELMCHPGLAPEEPRFRHWRYGHEEELRALTSPVTRELLAARDIRLCRFRDFL